MRYWDQNALNAKLETNINKNITHKMGKQGQITERFKELQGIKTEIFLIVMKKQCLIWKLIVLDNMYAQVADGIVNMGCGFDGDLRGRFDFEHTHALCDSVKGERS